MSTAPFDPMEFLNTLWGGAAMPLPGLIAPTLDAHEIDKRIADLKAVEGWLKTNLGLLQLTIQGLEMQRATLASLSTLQDIATGATASATPDPATSMPWQHWFNPLAFAAAASAATPPTAESPDYKK